MKNKLTKSERKAAYLKMSNKEKALHDGKRLIKICDVVRRIIHVCVILSFVVGITFIVIGACHKAMEVQDAVGLVKMEEGQSGVILVSVVDGETITLKENTPEGWNQFYMEIGAYCFAICVMMIAFMLIAKFLKNIFTQVMDKESPFSEESKKPLGKIFILLTVVIFFQEQLLGIVCGFIFLYLYRLFAYGCELQVEADETL